MERYDLDPVLRSVLIPSAPMHCAPPRRNGVVGRRAGHRVDLLQMRARRVGGLRQLHDVVDPIDRNARVLRRRLFRMQREQHALVALHRHVALLLDHVIDVVRVENHRRRLAAQLESSGKTVFVVLAAARFLAAVSVGVWGVAIVVDRHAQTVIIAVILVLVLVFVLVLVVGEDDLLALQTVGRRALVAILVHIEQHVFDLVSLSVGEEGVDHVVRNVRVDVHLLPALAVGLLQLEQTFDLFRLEETRARSAHLIDLLVELERVVFVFRTVESKPDGREDLIELKERCTERQSTSVP